MTKQQLYPKYLIVMRISSFFQALILTVVISLIKFKGFNVSYNSLIFSAILFALLAVLFQILAGLAYNRWFYEFTENQLKIERGVIWKKYSNIPYRRVQNVEITRGIFARLFGYSCVWIQTAGSSGINTAEGLIPAVSAEDAEKIREWVIKKTDKKIKAGL